VSVSPCQQVAVGHRPDTARFAQARCEHVSAEAKDNPLQYPRHVTQRNLHPCFLSKEMARFVRCRGVASDMKARPNQKPSSIAASASAHWVYPHVPLAAAPADAAAAAAVVGVRVRSATANAIRLWRRADAICEVARPCVALDEDAPSFSAASSSTRSFPDPEDILQILS